jgi:hypothetical protein
MSGCLSTTAQTGTPASPKPDFLLAVKTAEPPSAILNLMERAVNETANARGETIPRGEAQVFVGSGRARRYAVRGLGIAFALPPLLWAMSLFLGTTGFASLPVHARLTTARRPAHVSAVSVHQASRPLHGDAADRRGSTV